MTDIVERLREAHPNSMQYAAGSTILADAADEIEKLRSSLKEMVELAHHAVECQEDLDALNKARGLVEQNNDGEIKWSAKAVRVQGKS